MATGRGENSGRPRISLEYAGNTDRKICHNGVPTRVVMSKHLISVGCTDVTPEAVREILSLHEKHFGGNGDWVVIQP